MPLFLELQSFLSFRPFFEVLEWHQIASISCSCLKDLGVSLYCLSTKTLWPPLIMAGMEPGKGFFMTLPGLVWRRFLFWKSVCNRFKIWCLRPDYFWWKVFIHKNARKRVIMVSHDWLLCGLYDPHASCSHISCPDLWDIIHYTVYTYSQVIVLQNYMHDDRLAACCLLPLAPTNFYLPSSSKIRATRFEVCVPLARHQGILGSVFYH